MKYLVSTPLTIFLLCCSPSNSNDPLLEEAFGYHQEALQVHDEVISMLDTLNQRITTVNPTDSSLIDHQQVLEKIEQDFALWDESLISVPGYEPEHEHDHGHDHDHEHHDHANELKDLSSQQMLELQKDLKSEITRIQGRVDSLLAKTK